MKKKWMLWILSCFLVGDCQAFIKEFGFGECGVAFPQSSTTARYNPAGIAVVGNRWDVSGGAIYLNGRVKIADSPLPILNQEASTTQCKWIPAGVFGISKKITPQITAAFSTDAGITSSKGTIPGGLNAFGTPPLSSESLIAVLVPSLAYSTGCHHFGVSVPLNVSRISVAGFQNYTALSLYPENVTNKGYDYAEAVNLRFGYLYYVPCGFALGVSYFTPQVWSSSFKKYKGLIPNAGKMEVAPELRLGATYFFSRATVGAQFTLFNFKASRSFANPINGLPLGSKEGAGGGFENVYSFHVGGDYQINNSFKVRGGFVYFIDTFINPPNVAAGFIRPTLFARSTWTFGCTQKLCGFDIDYLFTFSPRRQISSEPIVDLGGAVMTSRGYGALQLIGLSRSF